MQKNIQLKVTNIHWFHFWKHNLYFVALKQNFQDSTYLNVKIVLLLLEHRAVYLMRLGRWWGILMLLLLVGVRRRLLLLLLLGKMLELLVDWLGKGDTQVRRQVVRWKVVQMGRQLLLLGLQHQGAGVEGHAILVEILLRWRGLPAARRTTAKKTVLNKNVCITQRPKKKYNIKIQKNTKNICIITNETYTLIFY